MGRTRGAAGGRMHHSLSSARQPFGFDEWGGGLVDVQHGKQSLRPPFSLSPSLRPPRRLEKRIFIGLPNFEERVALLKLKLKARQRQGVHSRWLPRACAARSSAAGARSWLFTFQLG